MLSVNLMVYIIIYNTVVPLVLCEILGGEAKDIQPHKIFSNWHKVCWWDYRWWFGTGSRQCERQTLWQHLCKSLNWNQKKYSKAWLQRWIDAYSNVFIIPMTLLHVVNMTDITNYPYSEAKLPIPGTSLEECFTVL